MRLLVPANPPLRGDLGRSSAKGAFDSTAASKQSIDDLGETIAELLNEDGARLDESRNKLEIFLVVDEGGKETDIKLMEMLAKKRN